jgi:hypothetical protein
MSFCKSKARPPGSDEASSSGDMVRRGITRKRVTTSTPRITHPECCSRKALTFSQSFMLSFDLLA